MFYQSKLPCLGPPCGGKFLTRRAEGGLGPGAPTWAAWAAAAAAATAAALEAAAEAPFEAAAEADEVAGDVVSAAVEGPPLLLLLALFSNIPGGDGSIAAAHSLI